MGIAYVGFTKFQANPNLCASLYMCAQGGLFNGCDNCPKTANYTQNPAACALADTDTDGRPDQQDNCRLVSNATQVASMRIAGSTGKVSMVVNAFRVGALVSVTRTPIRCPRWITWKVIDPIWIWHEAP